MKIALIAPLAASLLVLAACENKPETVETTAPDPQAEALANAAPVELPPSVKTSKTYRCADGSVVKVDFMTDDKSATITPEGGTGVTVKTETAGEPMTAEGARLSGTGATVSIMVGGKGSQSCKG